MRSWYVNLPVIGEVYAEYPSLRHGIRFVETVKKEGERLLWAGRFHAAWTSVKKIRELEARSFTDLDE